ncbi:hypothetical protein PFISCL1PPCAC_18304, partial [Pristionchus fissidentatus]
SSPSIPSSRSLPTRSLVFVFPSPTSHPTYPPHLVIMVTFMAPLSMPIRVWMHLQGQQPMFGQMLASPGSSSPYDDLQSDYVQNTQWSIASAVLGPKC